MISSRSGIEMFGFARSGRRSLRRVLLYGAFVSVALLYVGAKASIYRLGYQLNDMKVEKQKLEQANRALRIEAATLTAPARIEEIAVRRMGMVRPDKEHIVVVKRKADEPAAPGLLDLLSGGDRRK